jgi:hypothetical protein
MKLFILFTLFLTNIILAQDLPLGYILQYQEEFASPKIHEDIIVSEHCKNKIEKGWFIISEKQDTMPRFYPASVVLIDNHIFGEYSVSMRIKPKFDIADSSSALFLLLGLRDSLNYYFVEINQYKTSFCSMYKGNKTILVSDTSFSLLNNKIVVLKIKRDILKRSITITKNGDEISFSDPNLVMGYFGLGVENSTLALDRISIWAPTSIEQPAPVFRDSVLIN